MTKAHLLLTTVLLALVGCANHYNDMVKWADEEIPDGVSIDSVKNLQPDYLEIAWDKPDTMKLWGDTTKLTILFDITEIKGNRDILKMQNLLIFVDGKYAGREARH